MYLKYVQIRNFKNLSNAKFEFDKGANTIIGENDSGKTNAMQAIRILLDSDFYYNVKRLKETDFSNHLGDWKGHWIIISAFFEEITSEDETNEIVSGMVPEKEDESFLKSYIRCSDKNYGTVTLFIRPTFDIRKKLAEASNKTEFDEIRSKITLFDYEFYYTSRSQIDFLDDDRYKLLVGDFENAKYATPIEDDSSVLGTKINMLDVWKYISVSYIDALRDVEAELKKPKNPLRRTFDAIQSDISDMDKQEIVKKIQELNKVISNISQISNIGNNVNDKLNEIVGLVYSPNIEIESRLKADIQSLAKYLSVIPSGFDNIDFLGLGHLNILYIALKLIEFDYRKEHQILNIMIVEEPEAHVHTHIQRTLFENLKLSKDYTQVIMTTHSTHLSEVSEIKKVNVLKADTNFSTVMKPTTQLDVFGNQKLNIKDLSLTECLERYLDSKRSVLLFSKGVILVEGDAEEIMLPNLIKTAFGVSLDELGIGVINIGSVSFEYIASIFDDLRIQRHCAIVTDSDTYLENASKSSKDAEVLGLSRKEKLDGLFNDNKWVKSFYSKYTFEVDFAEHEINRNYIEKIINEHFSYEKTIEKHINKLNGTDSERYDSVLTIAKEIGKGWFSVLLSKTIDNNVIIPDYLLDAVAYSCQDIINKQIIEKISIYVLQNFKGTEEDFSDTIAECYRTLPTENNFIRFLEFLKEYKS